MRGFVVVSRSPWVQVCSREGRFRFDDVPDGRYVLTVWHEMGDKPLRRQVSVEGPALDLKTLAVTARPVARQSGESAPVRPWPDVIDRIGVLLASGLDAATRSGGLKKARALAEDAYWGEFEASGMETAVRLHLGFNRAGELERRFREVRSALREVAEGRQDASQAAGLTRQLLLDLVRASSDLNRKGVTDGSRAWGGSGSLASAPATGGANRGAQLLALRRGLEQVRDLADRGEADEAASAMTSVYFDEFEPIETFVAARKPQDVRPLEAQFNRIRGEVGAGLKGAALSERLDGLRADVELALGRSEAQPSGAFGPAFLASLITILREGVEVILILTMLVALVAKAGQGGALRAIGWGVGLALVASALTALGLNRMVASAQGRTRELVEGLVMLTATGVLFYVSYWLISQSESKRWLDYLKRRARKGAELGGFGTLALTAFLAVYREGAETALMYQAMIGTQAQSRAGLAGLGAGLGVGLVLLAGIALAVRATSVRLPLRTFFKLTGLVLFAMAVVFAGHGVFELQQAGLLRVTTLEWLGQGLPGLGLYPNVQALSVQALLLAGAVLALLLLVAGPRPEPAKESRTAAGVGV
jgi:high-affinity iron transporter